MDNRCHQEFEEETRSEAFAKAQEKWKEETEARIRSELEQEFDSLKRKVVDDLFKK